MHTRQIPLVLLLLWCGGALRGEVKGVFTIDRTDVLDGRPIGQAGAYERIVARAHFSLDPALPQNRAIRDLDLAPRNAAGRVEFDADIYVLRPRDVSKGNGTLLVEIPNRGGKGMLSRFNYAAGSLDPARAEEFGDLRLLEQGYTLAWIGWQWDVPRKDGLLRLHPPAALGVTGLVRSEYLPEKAETRMPLGDRGHLAYAPAESEMGQARLGVRRTPEGEVKEIPASQWRWSADRQSIEIPAGMEPGLLYEFVYTAKDPPLTGLGLAAVRDFTAWAYRDGSGIHVLGDMNGKLKRALAFGISQSGRFLRTFLYYGFNEDEKGRRVFDGIWADVAGAGRGSFNHRFAQASRDGYPWFNLHYATDLFPFADETQADPFGGPADGLLARVKPSTLPKIFYTNNSTEYWGRAAALIHVSPDGRRDLTPPENVRIYFWAGSQHGPGAIRDRAPGLADPPNSLDQRPFQRAALDALHDWVKDGKAPPESVYPKLAAGELVKPGDWKRPAGFRARLPLEPRLARSLDFGPEFREKGVVAIEPPGLGKAYPALVPQADADGNDRGGIRLPEAAVPLGVYTGWNTRAPETGSAGRMSVLAGAFFPFDKMEITKRYGSREQWLSKVGDAADELIRARRMIAEDRERVLRHAGQVWDAVFARP